MRHAYVDTAFGQNYYESEGSGFPLFLLHQADTSSFEFQNALPILARKFRVLAPDTPGFGRSDPAPSDWKLEDYARNVVVMMDTLGIERAHVGGHHTGAVIAAEVAAAFPRRVAKLVLSGLPLYKRDGTWWQEWAPKYRKLFAETAMPFPAEPPNDLQADGSHLNKVWKLMARQNPKSDLQFVQRCFIAMLLHFDKRGGSAVLAQMEYDRLPRLPLIKAPTLCLCGTDDFGPPLFEPPETVAQLIPGAVQKWIKGGGIGVDYEIPEQWAQPILDFLVD